MCVKAPLGLERFEIEKSRALSRFSWKILDLGFTKEWFVLKIASKYVPLNVWVSVHQKVASNLLKIIATDFVAKS